MSEELRSLAEDGSYTQEDKTTGWDAGRQGLWRAAWSCSVGQEAAAHHSHLKSSAHVLRGSTYLGFSRVYITGQETGQKLV